MVPRKLPLDVLSMDEAIAADGHRAQQMLARVGLQPPRLIPKLALTTQDAIHFTPRDTEAARTLLVQRRMSDPLYRPPETQKRHMFRTKKQKAVLCDTSSWSFTKHEVARALDVLLCARPLAPVATARSLLDIAGEVSLTQLWHHLHDPLLGKTRKQKNNMSDVSRVSSLPELTWLATVTHLDNIEYIQLFCSKGVSGPVLSQAFGIALAKSSLRTMATLLSFGADTSKYYAVLMGRFGHRDLELLALFLSAPKAMAGHVWRVFLRDRILRPPAGAPIPLEMLLMCCANRPDLIDGSLLVTALVAQSVQALAIVLAYGSIGFADVTQEACRLATLVSDRGRRLLIFSLLAAAGLVVDGPASREELLRSVREDDSPDLTKLLVNAGVLIDGPGTDALGFAVSRFNFSLITLLITGRASSPVIRSLSYVPDGTPEKDIIRLLHMLVPIHSPEHIDAPDDFLDTLLLRAVEKRQSRLAEVLIRYGASVEANDGAALQMAIAAADFDMLTILLFEGCSPDTIAATLPIAMTLTPRKNRLRVFGSLLEKQISCDVLKSALSTVIRGLVLEEGDIDSDLVRLALAYDAPVDCSDDDDSSPIIVATRRGDMDVLRMLANAQPRADTLAAAVPVAFETVDSLGYHRALASIALLLNKGAVGPLVDQTLLMAWMSDSRLEIVRALLAHGADVNHAGGQAFVFAIESDNKTLLEMMCSACQLTQASLEAAMRSALLPAHYSLQTVELLLGSSTPLTVSKASQGISQLLEDSPSPAEVIPRLLKHGMDVNVQGGLLLCLAINLKRIDLLDNILSSGPSMESLGNAFTRARTMQPKGVRLNVWRLLLRKATSNEIGQSSCLVQETKAALGGDSDGLRLLLSHKADIDCDDGQALEDAAAAGSLDVLNLLIAARPSDSAIQRAFTAAASPSPSGPLANRSLRVNILKVLLSAGNISSEVISKALSDSVANDPGDMLIPGLMLLHGAKVSIETLETALASSPRRLFEALVSKVSNPFTAKLIFTRVRQTPMDAEQRYWAYSCLLTSYAMKLKQRGSILRTLMRKNDDGGDLSAALLDSIRDEPSNTDIPKLLLEHGALVGHGKGEVLSLGLISGNLRLIRLLGQYMKPGRDDSVASRALAEYLEHPSTHAVTRRAIFECLLQANIKPALLHKALIDELMLASPDIPIIRLLIEAGAAPLENNAQAFIVACKKNNVAAFHALSRRADLNVILPVLMDALGEEEAIVKWCGICVEEHPGPLKIKLHSLLYKCMRKFPDGTALLDFIMDHGVSQAAVSSTVLRRGGKKEKASALIWGLASTRPRISNDVLIRLVERGNKSFAAYKSPESGISALFLCLLDTARTPVLEALLRFHDKEAMLACTILGSVFRDLAPPPPKKLAKKKKKDNEDEDAIALFDMDEDIDPHYASLYLGNLAAFRLVARPDPETLHFAALLALPDFVSWLLDARAHDPNHASDLFDLLTPLALACKSRPFPVTRGAASGPWPARLRETMRLLAPVTDRSWRQRRRSVLHVALEAGPAATEAMVEALGVRGDRERDVRYGYTDKTGKEYTPCEYVEEILEADGEEKRALVGCLKSNGWG